MASIGTISNGETGLSVRSKLNLAIAEANKVALKLDASQKGAADGLASLDATGKVPTAQLPDIPAGRKIVVADEAARLALPVHPDLTIAYQSDTGDAWGLDADSDPSIAANWTLLGNAQAGGVTSFNGRTGNVTPQAGDYTAAQVGAIPGAEKGAADGVATLDETGKVPAAQLPAAGIEDAPADGIAYVRKNEAWTPAASPGSGGPYTVAQRDGSTAGQVHVFTLASPQYAFDLGAYALKEGTAATNQSIFIETFGADSETDYQQTGALVWGGDLSPYTGEVYQTEVDGSFYLVDVRADGQALNVTTEEAFDTTSDILGDNSDISLFTFNGNVSDLSGNYDASWGGTPTYADGVFDQAASFGGTSYIEIPRQPLASKTITFWIKPDSNTEQQFMSLAGNTYGLSGTLFSTNNGSSDLVFSTHGLSGINPPVKNISLPVTSISEFMYIAIVIDANEVVENVYLNQDTVGVNTTARGRYDVSETSWRLGIRTSGGYSFSGRIDQMRVFNRNLSPGELDIVYNESSPINHLFKDANGSYYTASAGVLSPVAAPATASDIEAAGNADSGNIPAAQLTGLLPISVVTGVTATVATNYTPYNQIAFEQPRSVSAWSEINAATLTTTETGAGQVRVAVSRNGTDWYSWNSTAWVSLGGLAADTASADALLANGMSATVLNALTWAEWEPLFAGTEDGTPDALAFAYALSVPDPATDEASISNLSVNVDLKAGWQVQSPSSVLITWFNDQVTFRTVSAGNYRFAYQTP